MRWLKLKFTKCKLFLNQRVYAESGGVNDELFVIGISLVLIYLVLLTSLLVEHLVHSSATFFLVHFVLIMKLFNFDS